MRIAMVAMVAVAALGGCKQAQTGPAPVTEAEATQFACSVINIGRNILMGSGTTDLAARLADHGFDVTQLDLSEFQRGGGSAKSLALRLSDVTLAEAV